MKAQRYFIKWDGCYTAIVPHRGEEVEETYTRLQAIKTVKEYADARIADFKLLKALAKNYKGN